MLARALPALPSRQLVCRPHSLLFCLQTTHSLTIGRIKKNVHDENGICDECMACARRWPTPIGARRLSASCAASPPTTCPIASGCPLFLFSWACVALSFDSFVNQRSRGDDGLHDADKQQRSTAAASTQVSSYLLRANIARNANLLVVGVVQALVDEQCAQFTSAVAALFTAASSSSSSTSTSSSGPPPLAAPLGLHQLIDYFVLFCFVVCVRSFMTEQLSLMLVCAASVVSQPIDGSSKSKSGSGRLIMCIFWLSDTNKHV